jgi:hypothetical protein
MSDKEKLDAIRYINKNKLYKKNDTYDSFMTKLMHNSLNSSDMDELNFSFLKKLKYASPQQLYESIDYEYTLSKIEKPDVECKNFIHKVYKKGDSYENIISKLSNLSKEEKCVYNFKNLKYLNPDEIEKIVKKNILEGLNLQFNTTPRVIKKPELKCLALIAYYRLYKKNMGYPAFEKNMKEFVKKENNKYITECLDKIDFHALKTYNNEELNYFFDLGDEKRRDNIKKGIVATGAGVASIAVIVANLLKEKAPVKKAPAKKAKKVKK